MPFNRLTIFLWGLWLLMTCPAQADGITTIAKTNKLLKKAEEAFKAKDFKTVIESYEAALKEKPDLPEEVSLNLGNAYLETKQYSKAGKHLTTAATLSRSPELRSKALQQMGTLYAQQQDYKSALDFYKKSLKNNPANETARHNYELAWHLNKKKEEQQKQNRPPEPKDEQPKDEKKEEKDGQKEKQQNQEQKEEQKGKEQAKKDSEQGRSKQDAKDEKKPGKEGDDKNAQAQQTDQKGNEGNQEQEEKEGKEKSKSKGEESNMDDPNSVKIDKNKLRESGLSEEQAKSLLQAMRNSEVKYLQQRRFGGRKSRESDGKPKW